ncbi:hypothetical protein GQ44DRAFT_355053 [Phaeosphaeriaceae sp. PMI808]|nr:hypothetical protein GQ44DRAFT_355053 [Phaeosphaeriaceae sp. PMI808]
MANNQPAIPDHEIKQNAGVSAGLALQAAQKAWELRQAANAAGDPDAREEILAKAINKEIEAESFGKAAKYTRSGAFQGLAAGAGLGVQPGVTLGKLTGALVGGVVATVTGLLGGGVGSVYGAINGPFWDLGEMASHGVRGIIGDFPNWKSTPAQKRALEKMVMQTKETQAPTQEELEQMKAEAPDNMPQSWSQRTSDLTSWRPSMPSMPSMPKGAALGLGGMGASMPFWGGGDKNQKQQQLPSQTRQKASNQSTAAAPKQADQPKEQLIPKEAPTPKEAPQFKETHKPKANPNPKETPKSKDESTQAKKSLEKPPNQKSASPKTQPKPTPKSQPTSSSDAKENKPPVSTNGEKKKPRKLDPKRSSHQSSQTSAPRKAPRKLESRKPTAA